MKHIVWINPDEYDAFMKTLGEHGFTWTGGGEEAGDGTNIIERFHDKNCSTTYSIDIGRKSLSYCPLEIYDKSSPTRDDKKFNKIKSDCKSCSWFVEKVLNGEE